MPKWEESICCGVYDIEVRHGVCSFKADSPEGHMLWMITVLLVLLWLVGMVSGYTLGSWIHILLVLAIVSVAISLIRRGTHQPLSRS